jgi:NAD(P)-dependent dehydrogenase (short-subunit alcohol dehydrogenase family)
MIETNSDANSLRTDQFRNVISGIPLQSAGRTIDLANGIVFLASNDAQYITGINLAIDGGLIYSLVGYTAKLNNTL